MADMTDTKQRARELLALAFEHNGQPTQAHFARAGRGELVSNKVALDAIEAALSERGEVVAWMTPESIAHLAKQNGVAKVDAWNCSNGNDRVPVFITPSASVPVEKLRELAERWTKRASAYGHAGYTGAYSEGRSDAQNECVRELESLIQQEIGNE